MDMKRYNRFLHWGAALASLLFLVACRTADRPQPHADPEVTELRLKEARARLDGLRSKLDRLAAAQPAEINALVVELGLADKAFFELHERRGKEEKELVNLGYRYLEGHPKMKEQRALLASLDEELADKANWIRYQLKKETAEIEDTVRRLEGTLAESRAVAPEK